MTTMTTMTTVAGRQNMIIQDDSYSWTKRTVLSMYQIRNTHGHSLWRSPWPCRGQSMSSHAGRDANRESGGSGHGPGENRPGRGFLPTFMLPAIQIDDPAAQLADPDRIARALA